MPVTVVLPLHVSVLHCPLTLLAFSPLASFRRFPPPGKFDMVDIQNATLAGGVAIGGAADFRLSPLGALIVGLIAAILSATGFAFVQPALERAIGLAPSARYCHYGMPQRANLWHKARMARSGS